MTTYTMTPPEALILWNSIADYFYEMVLRKPLTVQMVRDPERGAAASIWIGRCDTSDAIALLGISIRRPSGLMDPVKFSLEVDGYRVVDGLMLPCPGRLGPDYFASKEDALFKALTPDRQRLGLFLPNGSLLVGLLDPKSDIDAEIFLETAIYTAKEMEDGRPKRYEFPKVST